jgi:hypothetical protein
MHARTFTIAGLLLAIAPLSPAPLHAQATMGVDEYQPRSTLRVAGNPRTRAKYPFVDVHGHQGGLRSDEQVATLVRQMDSLNMRAMVNLSGGSGERLVSTCPMTCSGSSTRATPCGSIARSAHGRDLCARTPL